MAENQLVTFIKAERAKGVADETIRIMLTANGWTLDDIEEAYASFDGHSTKKGPGSKRGLLYVILLVILVAIIVWYFFVK